MNLNACNCIGPQNGEPVCPCLMRNVKIINGRYVTTSDLGPAPNGGLPKSLFTMAGPSFNKKEKEGTRVRCPISGADLGPAD